MELNLWPLMFISLYKIACLLTGLGISYMGYRLFVLGKTTVAGDLDIESKEKKLLLGKAAPGTFFALFGAALVMVTILKGFEYDIEQPDKVPSNQIPNVLDDKPPFPVK